MDGYNKFEMSRNELAMDETENGYRLHGKVVYGMEWFRGGMECVAAFRFPDSRFAYRGSGYAYIRGNGVRINSCSSMYTELGFKMKGQEKGFLVPYIPLELDSGAYGGIMEVRIEFQFERWFEL